MNRTSVALATGPLPFVDDAAPDRIEALHRLPTFTCLDLCPCPHCTGLRLEAYELARQSCEPLYHHNGSALRDAQEQRALDFIDRMAKAFVVLLYLAFVFTLYRAFHTGAL